jgi:hypothetical protein
VKPTKNSFTSLSAYLILAGVSLSVISYFILRSTPFTALGLSTIILGGVSFALGRGQSKIPPEVSAVLLQSGIENISALVEEFGLKSKAIYLPSSLTTGKSQALISLNPNPQLLQLKNIALPKRLIVKYGPNPEDVGLLLTTPGSAVSGMVTAKPDASDADLETALFLVLSGTINLADGARAIRTDTGIRIEVSNPRLENRKMWVYESLGSPLASIVASVVAEVLDKPVTIESEKYRLNYDSAYGKCIIELRLTGRSL